MKLFFDFLPIISFFIAYKIWNIYIATAVTMAVTALIVGYYWLRYRKVETLPIITLILVLILGSFTLLLHEAIYIKWKPTVIYWLFSLGFLLSHFFGKKTLIERVVGDKIELPKQVWSVLSYSWATFFAVLGAINLYVVYHYSTNTWVYFKLFGTLGLTLLFIIGQAIYMARHIEKDPVEKK